MKKKLHGCILTPETHHTETHVYAHCVCLQLCDVTTAEATMAA